MNRPILVTKLHIPQQRAELVSRPRLIERMNEGMHHKLTLISAPAGFGKTTLVSEWSAACEQTSIWLSLDEGDNDPVRFLSYLVAALQTIVADIGEGALSMLHASQSPAIDLILTELLNEIAAVPNDFSLILDDYHLIDAKNIDESLAFLVEYMPPQMHLIITTREDPDIPLARLRVQGQLTELRSADLRFTRAEAARFLNKVMNLNLSETNIDALEARTEGWIAGLQLASLALQGTILLEGQKGTSRFIKAFTGSHHFVLDYLVEEVLGRQSESVQSFLLRTSILDRMCGSLCDAVVMDPSAFGQGTLEYLERSNLFLVPLDNERRWYRYHHLFSELLRQQLFQSATSSPEGAELEIAKYHRRASQWYEDNGFDIDAFHHATVAEDITRAERLIEGKGVPLYFRGALTPILQWLDSLPASTMNEKPSLWTTYAAVLMGTGKTKNIERILESAENAIQKFNQDEKTRDIIGRIASSRAMLALMRNQFGDIISHSLRALDYLSLDNVPYRTATICKLGIAYQIQGNRNEAKKLLTEAIAISLASGDVTTNITASLGLGIQQAEENLLYQAAQTYSRAIQLATGLPFAGITVAYLGLARIYYQWNDMDTSQMYCQQGFRIAQQIENSDWFVLCQLVLARIKLAQNNINETVGILEEANRSVLQLGFDHLFPELVEERVMVLLRQGNLTAAVLLAQTHGSSFTKARVYLAQGDTIAALAELEPRYLQVEKEHREDEQLKIMVLLAIVLYAHDEKDKALKLLGEALALAEPGGIIRAFVDEGLLMAELLIEAAALGIMPHYINKILSVYGKGAKKIIGNIHQSSSQLLNEQLSHREMEILHLVASGLSNREIGEKLYLALDTVKGHNRRLFEKLQVKSRTEAISRARELGLI